MDVTAEVCADVGSSTACRRTPCPHCILGVGHSARLEEAMMTWQQRVWDYSEAGTGPDDTYWMRLMACQWIGSLEVAASPGMKKGFNARYKDVPKPRGMGTLTGPMKVQAVSLPQPRYVQHADQRPTPPMQGPLQPTFGNLEKDQHSTRHGYAKVMCDADAATENAGPCSAAAGDACPLFEPPPGLGEPANVSGWPVWQFEEDPRADEWIAMNQALNWHLEEVFQQGIGQTTFCLHGVDAYFDLVAMYMIEPFTDTRRRIRRRVI